MACGTGVEGCDPTSWSPELNAKCKVDPRIDWRGLVIKTDLNGEKVWHRQDNYQSGEPPSATGKVASSASEFIFSLDDGSLVSITDESAGFGYAVIDGSGPKCAAEFGSGALAQASSRSSSKTG